MSPQWQELITGIEGIEITKVKAEQDIVIYADYVGPKECRHCEGRRVRLKDDYFRSLKHTRRGPRLIWLRLRVFKFQCLDCKRYSVSQVKGILARRQSTENFRQEVFEKHHGGLSQSHLAETHQIGSATVERWYQDFIVYRVSELKGRACPRVLGIDEHFFTRKQGYATTLVDLRNGKVFDVTLGRSEASLAQYLRGLKERWRVKLVVMDLSETYRSIVQKYFPNAKIVSDRFHVVRLVNYYFQRVWQSLDAQAKKNRGLLSLMRRHPWNLSSDQKVNLQKYIQSIPGLEAITEIREKILKLLLLKNLSKVEARPRLHEFLDLISHLLGSPIDFFQSLGKTLQSWKEEILRMWRVNWSNGMTEGFHNKMEMISRRAFGFKNFNNYRLRVIALCGWDGLSRRY